MGLIPVGGGAGGGVGPQGPQGFQGFQGVLGGAGPQGFQGNPGAQGAQGAAGSNTWPQLMPTNTLAESAWHTQSVSDNNPLASGTLFLVPIWLQQGTVIGHLNFWTGSVAATAPTHQWAGLFDSARVLLAETADQGAAAIGATAKLSLAIAQIASGAASSFTTTYTGLHYIGILITATTVPRMYGTPSQPFGAGPLTDTPAAGSSTTGLTTPPAFPFTAAAITASTIDMYAAAAA